MILRKEFYSKFKGPRVGFCRICGSNCELTYDHVPPQSCFNNTRIVLHSFPGYEYNQFYNSGLKIRSICSNCNNNILGGNFDQELASFVKRINYNIFSKKYGIIRHKNNSYTIKSRMVLKSILGHILAAYDPLTNLSNAIDPNENHYPNRIRNFGASGFRVSKHNFSMLQASYSILPSGKGLPCGIWPCS
jgi:hypothetical protein